MQVTKNYLKNEILTENEKNKRWENTITTRLNWWENEFKRINKLNCFTAGQKELISKEIRQMTQLEIDGGKCPVCRKEWIVVEFNNVFGSGRYFKPDCQCFFKCPRCKNQLYDLKVTTRLKMKNFTCPGCGWVLLYNGDKRFGPVYEKFYDGQQRKPKNINIEKAEKDKRKKEKENKEKKK